MELITNGDKSAAGSICKSALVAGCWRVEKGYAVEDGFDRGLQRVHLTCSRLDAGDSGGCGAAKKAGANQAPSYATGETRRPPVAYLASREVSLLCESRSILQPRQNTHSSFFPRRNDNWHFLRRCLNRESV